MFRIKPINISILLLLFINAKAQTKMDLIPGEYYLTGVREMASGFWLKPDSSFEFFFSYGALDRAGKGHWRVDDEGNVVLNSGTRHPADFKLISSVKKTSPGVRFKVAGTNPMVLQHVVFRMHTPAGDIDKTTNSHGEVIFPAGKYKEIQVLFELCPDRFSVISLPDGDFNEYTVQIEEWITEVYCQNLRLKPEDGKLTGGHPLMAGTEYSYRKQGQQ
ncbi:hypothetical protein [Pollutibacter soli]|uniref:hypothetical protein n=1 Tax=Pollutibacter soli TaxID=3034157 RepID=UPI0030132D6E